MRLRTCRDVSMAILVLATLQCGFVPAADDPAGQVVIIREAGRPDKRCIVEKSIPQANGTLLHEVRNLSTGERFRVIDHRPHSQATPSLATSERKDSNRPPTPAELAGVSSMPINRSSTEQRSWLHGTTSTTVDLAASVPSIPSVISAASDNWPGAEQTAGAAKLVPKQIRALRSSPDAAARETAALALAACEWRTKTEVADALASAAKSDPDASVRICCLRCLCQLSKDLPQVIPTIQQLQSDSDQHVQQVAHKAMGELTTQTWPGSQR